MGKRAIRAKYIRGNTGTASAAGAGIPDVFAKAGVARLPILALEGTIRCFLSLPLLLIDRLDVPVMLVDRLDVPVIGRPFEPPGQGGRREGGDQEEGNKTSAHCGSSCVVPLC